MLHRGVRWVWVLTPEVGVSEGGKGMQCRSASGGVLLDGTGEGKPAGELLVNELHQTLK